MKPKVLYHGSSKKIEGSLKPILITGKPGYSHTKAAVFGTERADVASLFMFPEKYLASIGFEKDIAFICIWGKREDFQNQDITGYLYTLPTETFEKVGKEYEWQSFSEVTPLEVKEYSDSIEGMMEQGVQVYFINDEALMDKIVDSVYHRAPILKKLTSENQKIDNNVRTFKI